MATLPGTSRAGSIRPKKWYFFRHRVQIVISFLMFVGGIVLAAYSQWGGNTALQKMGMILSGVGFIGLIIWNIIRMRERSFLFFFREEHGDVKAPRMSDDSEEDEAEEYRSAAGAPGTPERPRPPEATPPPEP